jgi:hypothetical protein
MLHSARCVLGHHCCAALHGIVADARVEAAHDAREARRSLGRGEGNPFLAAALGGMGIFVLEIAVFGSVDIP